MSTIKPGDTVYVIATCADAWKRGSGTCYFYENGNCPFQQSGRLEHCGDREHALDVFAVKVGLVEIDAILLQGITFGFSAICESVSRRYIGSHIFADRPAAEKALEQIDAKRRERTERAKARRYERNHAPEPENYSLWEA